eukprot:421123_1
MATLQASKPTQKLTWIQIRSYIIEIQIHSDKLEEERLKNSIEIMRLKHENLNKKKECKMKECKMKELTQNEKKIIKETEEIEIRLSECNSKINLIKNNINLKQNNINKEINKMKEISNEIELRKKRNN